MDGDQMVEVLRIGREKMSDKGTKSAAKRVDPLRSQTGLAAGRDHRPDEGHLPRTLRVARPARSPRRNWSGPQALVDGEVLHGREWLHRVP